MSDEKKEQYRKELAAALGAMTYMQEFVYSCAQQQQVHPFIKLSGLMKQYLDLCQAKFNEGGDFVMERLPLQDHGVEYLAEKVGMLYPALTDPALLDVLRRTILGTQVSIDLKRELHIVFSPQDARDWAALVEKGLDPIEAAKLVLQS